MSRIKVIVANEKQSAINDILNLLKEKQEDFELIISGESEGKIKEGAGLDARFKRADDSLKQLEEKITDIFMSVGIPAHIKGYRFLREAIKLAVKEPPVINSITKILYPTIAEKYETSSSKVERAIRHAIEVAWNRGRVSEINNLFGVKVYTNKDKPTNGEFIALIADKMLLEGA